MDAYDPNDRQVLFSIPNLRLIKATSSDGLSDWKFGGIASAESIDVDGDAILKKALDISYLQKRGYVNWDHSRAPVDQLGYCTKAEIVGLDQLPSLESSLGIPLDKSASIYVEGVLYKNSPRAKEVFDLLSSIPKGQEGSLGMSVEGGMIRSEDGAVKRAMVRGIAITPAPTHPDTLCRLVKALSSPVNTGVVHDSMRDQSFIFNDAVVRLLEMRPKLPLELAKRIVQYTIDRKVKEQTS